MRPPRPARALVTDLHVRDFRTMQELSLELGPVCSLVGEAQAGKSNLLAALRAVLEREADPVRPGDVRRGEHGLSVRARLAGGEWLELAGSPPEHERRGRATPPPVLFLPASERLAARPALEVMERLEARGDGRMRGVVVLVEEPELYLRPQAQRWCSRLLRSLAAEGNQVIQTTHSPAFLNVARLDEVVFVERRAGGGTKALRPAPLTPDEDFRVLSEFDAERAELFLARAALLVEGSTEKLALPFVFAALGRDADRDGISIVECGGKANLVLFARVCRAAGVPFVVLYDRDARAGQRPSATNRALHARLDELAGPGRAIGLVPDFEAVAHLHGTGHKPERAWRRFATLRADRMPGDLVRAVKLTVALARDDRRPGT